MENPVSRQTKSLRNLVFIAVIGISQSACFLNRAGTGIPPSDFSVTPANICPQDPINLSWDLYTFEPCWTGRPVVDTLRCSTVNSPTSDNPETPFSPSLDERTGSIDYDPGPRFDTSFSMTTLLTGRDAIVREDLSTSVNVIEVPTSINTVAEGLCADNAGIVLTDIVSQCVEITQICVAADNPSTGQYVLSGWRECAPGTPADICGRPAFRSDELRTGECISPSTVGLTSFQGLRLLDIDWRRGPIAVPIPRPDCALEGSGFNPPLGVILQTRCSGAFVGCESP